MFQWMKKIFHLEGPLGSHICLMFCIVSLSVDPLNLFVPAIDYDTNFIVFNKVLASEVLVLRLISDLYVSFQLRTHVSPDDAYTIGWLSLRYYSADLLGLLPLPPVVMNYMINCGSLSEISFSIKLMSWIIVFQFLPRVLRVYPLLTKATGHLDD